jgi:hypothetical protein
MYTYIHIFWCMQSSTMLRASVIGPLCRTRRTYIVRPLSLSLSLSLTLSLHLSLPIGNRLNLACLVLCDTDGRQCHNRRACIHPPSCSRSLAPSSALANFLCRARARAQIQELPHSHAQSLYLSFPRSLLLTLSPCIYVFVTLLFVDVARSPPPLVRVREELN